MAKQRLVVIGNGMAGARAVEEVLARGGGEMFDITMFGDEPYGNYNRILLSNILSGVQDTSEIFLNPLDWYAHNDIALHAGVRVTKIDRFDKTVRADDATIHGYDKLIVATGSRSFFPPIDGMLDHGRPLRASSAFATSPTATRCSSGHEARAALPSSGAACSVSRPRADCSCAGWRCTSSTARSAS